MTDLSGAPLPHLAPRGAATHKGDYGRVLVVGGSLGMAGAPAMSGMACLRSGAGLVTLFAPTDVQATAAAYCPAFMTRGLESEAGRFGPSLLEALVEAADKFDAIAIGPGLGRSPGLTESVASAYERIATPMVVDADGLNALAERPDTLTRPGGPRVLTPHAGEFARLNGAALADPDDGAERRDKAAALARRDPTGATVVVLKGARTVVTDGYRFSVNATGNPGMATAGAGDVLTGVVAALLGQGLSAFDAARLGAHTHGLAGDLAAKRLGPIGMIATDLIDNLPAAWTRLADPSAAD